MDLIVQNRTMEELHYLAKVIQCVYGKTGIKVSKGHQTFS